MKIPLEDGAEELKNTAEYTINLMSLLTWSGQQSLELTQEPSGMSSGHWGCAQAQTNQIGIGGSYPVNHIERLEKDET